MPKVSIIVPNYNHAQFLEQRLSSILQQTYQDFEVILLDDASTDNSCEILQKYLTDPRIRANFNSINSGSPFKQWNKGLQLAQGEYIWLAESDDYADATLLEKLVEKLEIHPNVGVAYCQSFQIDQYGSINSTLHFHTDELDKQRWKFDFIESGHVECSHYLSCKNTIPNASGVVFRKLLYQQVGGADATKVLCGDWLLWVKILLNSDVAFVAEPLNYFRKHTSTSRAKLTKLGYELSESLEILNLITQQIEVPPNSLIKAIDLTLKRWESILYSDTSKFSLKDHFNILRKIASIKINFTTKTSISLRIIRSLIRFARFRFKVGTRLKTLWNNPLI